MSHERRFGCNAYPGAVWRVHVADGTCHARVGQCDMAHRADCHQSTRVRQTHKLPLMQQRNLYDTPATLRSGYCCGCQ